MARPLRIELPGGLFPVTSRRDRREPSYLEDADRLQTSRAGLTFCLFSN
jgi:putative transposase